MLLAPQAAQVISCSNSEIGGLAVAEQVDLADLAAAVKAALVAAVKVVLVALEGEVHREAAGSEVAGSEVANVVAQAAEVKEAVAEADANS